MNLKKDILEIINAYRGEIITVKEAKQCYPYFKLDPVSIQVNDNLTDTLTFTAIIFDSMPTGCLNMSDAYDVACDDIDKYTDLLRAVVAQLCKRYKYRQSGSISIDQFPYSMTENKLYAIRIRASLITTSNGDCCNDDWFDTSNLPKTSWNE